jgi:dihydropyrimidinase
VGVEAAGRDAGGLDPHCHIEEPSEDGGVQEESFSSGSAAALAGGSVMI